MTPANRGSSGAGQICRVVSGNTPSCRLVVFDLRCNPGLSNLKCSWQTVQLLELVLGTWVPKYWYFRQYLASKAQRLKGSAQRQVGEFMTVVAPDQTQCVLLPFQSPHILHTFSTHSPQTPIGGTGATVVESLVCPRLNKQHQTVDQQYV